MGFPGTTLDKIEIDAQTFANWGVDYLKFDGCYSNPAEQILGKSSHSHIELHGMSLQTKSS